MLLDVLAVEAGEAVLAHAGVPPGTQGLVGVLALALAPRGCALPAGSRQLIMQNSSNSFLHSRPEDVVHTVEPEPGGRIAGCSKQGCKISAKVLLCMTQGLTWKPVRVQAAFRPY